MILWCVVQVFKFGVGGLYLRLECKVLDMSPKSVCAVEMTMYVHWTTGSRLRWQALPSSRMQALMQLFKAKGFSEEIGS